MSETDAEVARAQGRLSAARKTADIELDNEPYIAALDKCTAVLIAACEAQNTQKSTLDVGSSLRE